MQQTGNIPERRRSRIAVAIALSERFGNSTEVVVPVWLDMQVLSDLTGLSESSIRRMERGGGFPRLHAIGPRRRGLTLQAYIQWAEACQRDSECSARSFAGKRGAAA